MDHFRVEPICVMDAHSGGAHLVLTIGFIFSGAVDRAQIESAVKVLAGKWPVLGARLRRSSSNAQSQALEALIPDSQHAVLATTFYTTPKGIHQIETLPARTSTIATQRLSRNLELYFEKSQPTLEELISSESPAFRLHVSCLADATVFAFTFPHVLMDASAAGSVMRGLVSVLEGKAPLDELEGDPWADFVNTARPGADLNLRGWSTYGPSDFMASAETERMDLERDGPISQRTIYFPPAEIARLKEQAMRELKVLGLEVPLLSSGDVIVAWLYKNFYGDEQYDADRTSRLIYVLDARKYANCKIRDMSLGEIARLVRELVTEGSKRETVLDHLQWKHDHAGEVQVPVPSGERVLFASNWLMFGFGGLNISKAVKPGTGTGEVLDIYWCMPGIPRCSGCVTFRSSDGGINAVFDWAEVNWTSGSIGKYAIENMKTKKSKKGKAMKRLRIHALFSWYRRLIATRH
ncbi:Transferase family, partial [Rhizoctonia solani]